MKLSNKIKQSRHGAWTLSALLLVGGVILSWNVVPAVQQAQGQDATKTEEKASPGNAPTASKQASDDSKTESATRRVAVVAEPKQSGGESDGIVQVANLIYAGTKSSQCFADHFLVKAEKESAISTSRRFHAVKLSSAELYNFPLVIMTGEGSFQLPDEERQNLVEYVQRGGFLLASAGCSSQEWERSFRKEMAIMFPEQPLSPISQDHPVFHTVYDINQLSAKHGKPKPLEGVSLGGRLGVLYSQDGLNDTAHTQGCCCCGGNEIHDAISVNVNILAYALTH